MFKNITLNRCIIFTLFILQLQVVSIAHPIPPSAIPYRTSKSSFWFNVVRIFFQPGQDLTIKQGSTGMAVSSQEPNEAVSLTPGSIAQKGGSQITPSPFPKPFSEEDPFQRIFDLGRLCTKRQVKECKRRQRCQVKVQRPSRRRLHSRTHKVCNFGCKPKVSTC